MRINTKIYADGANVEEIKKLNSNPLISGFTTNPTLMRKAKVDNYEIFSKEVLSIIDGKPVSFEVFSDDLEEMYEQALKISSWGNNIYVKIPITNTKNESVYNIIEKLSNKGVKLNITAIMTLAQVTSIIPALKNTPAAYISVFAGRIADTGIDPLPMMIQVVKELSINKNIELIWASPRELLNVVQASEINCHIITITTDIIKKINLINKNLDQFSLETVKLFFNDALESGYKI